MCVLAGLVIGILIFISPVHNDVHIFHMLIGYCMSSFTKLYQSFFHMVVHSERYNSSMTFLLSPARSTNIFCKGPDCKYFQLCGPYCLCLNHSTLSLCHCGLITAINSVLLCSAKTLFTENMSGGRCRSPLI